MNATATLAIEAYFGEHYPEVCQEMATELFIQLTEQPELKGVPQERLAAMAFAATEQVRHALGGANLYVPRGTSYECSRRDLEIFAAFRGNNYDVLARQYGLTEMRVRQIITRCRRAELARRQGDLFAASAPVANSPKKAA